MANKPKEKHPQITTPVGVAYYPFLVKPNTKFDADGEYRVNLVLPQAEAKDLIKAIEQAMAASLEKARNENPKKAKSLRMANPPYTMVSDDAGNETGQIQFNFKAKAKITPRNGGEPFEVRIALFDAQGQAIVQDIKIGTGSRIKVCAELVPFFTDLVGAGITLRLKAVQIIELVEYTGPTAERFGFGAEAGYVANTTEDSDGGEDAEADF